MLTLAARPRTADCSTYFRQYVEKAPDGDVLATLEAQLEETAELLAGLSDEVGRSRYAPEKWSVKEVAQHLIDCERIFTCRALCFARGEKAPLPGFEENDYAAVCGADERSMRDLADELRTARAATLSLFRGLPDEAWERTGIANDSEFRVVSIPWILAGHERHHVGVLRERYGV